MQNVKDSDGTVVVYPVELRGGTEQTVRFCVDLKRPHQLIDASKISVKGATKLIADFVDKNKIGILNVAGPRQSEWPEGYAYASRVLSAFLKLSLVTQRFHRIEARGEVRRDQRREGTD